MTGRPSTDVLQRLRVHLWAMGLQKATQVSWDTLDERLATGDSDAKKLRGDPRQRYLARGARLGLIKTQYLEGIGCKGFVEIGDVLCQGTARVYWEPLWHILTADAAPSEQALGLMCNRALARLGLRQLQLADFRFAQQVCGPGLMASQDDLEAIRSGAMAVAQTASMDGLLILGIQIRSALARFQYMEAHHYTESLRICADGVDSKYSLDRFKGWLFSGVLMRLIRNDWSLIDRVEWPDDELIPTPPEDDWESPEDSEEVKNEKRRRRDARWLWEYRNYIGLMSRAGRRAIAGVPILSDPSKLIWYKKNRNRLLEEIRLAAGWDDWAFTPEICPAMTEAANLCSPGLKWQIDLMSIDDYLEAKRAGLLESL